MREFQLNFTRSMRQRAGSHYTAIDFEPCNVPPKAVVVVTQMTCPTSHHVSPKSANEESFFLFKRTPAAAH
jgi:hypothetical protein